MSKIDEEKVSKILETNLKINFSNSKFHLDGWGQVDNWVKLDNEKYLFLEIETSQKHPNTNVLKLWPYLDYNIEKKIFLIQTYFLYSPGLTSNRGKLSEWTASKLKAIYKNRFDYFKLVIVDSIDEKVLEELRMKINKFKNKTELLTNK